MVVPVVVPAHSGHTTVINKTIVYSDTVLNLKEKGKDLKVTSVSVSKYLFERCVQMILEENPNVVFNTIQYSYQQEKAIFYTDKSISTEKWQKRNEEKKEYLYDNASIEVHIKELLASDRPLNPDCVAIYDVLCLSKNIRYGEKTFEDSIKARINSKLNYINDDYYVTIHDMNYKTYECHILVREYMRHTDDREEEFWFKKVGSDVYISKKDGRDLIGDKILGIIGSEISELYEHQLKMSYKDKEPSVYIKAVNSGFSASMGYYGVKIYNGNVLTSTFAIEMYSYSNKIDYECNSANLLQLLRGNEYDLYKKIFVKISDCPSWMHQELLEFRAKQLVEEEKEREKQEQKRIKEEYKKLKKQKRREFWGKIFPFIK